MRLLFEDILDNIDLNDENSNIVTSLSNNDNDEPMDASSYNFLLKFKIPSSSVLLNADNFFKRIKKKISYILNYHLQIQDNSIVKCVSKIHNKDYSKISKEIEDNPHMQDGLWIMFSINANFLNFKNVFRFINLIFSTLTNICKNEHYQIEKWNMICYFSDGSNWEKYGLFNNLLENLIDLTNIDKSKEINDIRFIDYCNILYYQDLLRYFNIPKIETYFKFPELFGMGQSEWCRYSIESKFNVYVNFIEIDKNMKDRIFSCPIYIYSWGNKKDNKEIFLCPNYETLKKINEEKLNFSLISPKTNSTVIAKELKKELYNKELHVEKVFYYKSDDNGNNILSYIYIKTKESEVGLIILSHNRKDTLLDLWTFVSMENIDLGSRL